MLFSNNNLVRHSQELLYTVKTGKEHQASKQSLREIAYKQLTQGLSDDHSKKAFWINVYNAYTQILLQQNHAAYKNRLAFYSKKQIEIANTKFSLNNIEHDVLRRGKIWWSMGYATNPFVATKLRKLQPQHLDWRIHFALNCGAASCPPIAFYNDAQIEQQLNLAAASYLHSEVRYDAATNVLQVPKLMSWYRGDFGGRRGIIHILQQHNLVPAGVQPRIRFNGYDWKLQLGSFATAAQDE